MDNPRDDWKKLYEGKKEKKDLKAIKVEKKKK